jgi:hypothetical protein
MLSVMISGPRHREPAHYTAQPRAASLGSPPQPSAQLAAWKALIEEEFGDGNSGNVPEYGYREE